MERSLVAHSKGQALQDFLDLPLAVEHLEREKELLKGPHHKNMEDLLAYLL